MSNEDYSKVASSPVSPVATLSVAVLNPRQDNLPISGEAPGGAFKPGDMILVGLEVCRVKTRSSSTFYVDRGCADTIPMRHPAGTPVWLVEAGKYAPAPAEYTQGADLGGKIIMTAPDASMTIEQSPPNRVPLQYRHTRPYPPGLFLIDGQPWYEPLKLDDVKTDITLTWVGRNRISQGSNLVAHDAGHVDPEVGTTYSIEILNEQKEVVYGIDGIEANTYTITRDELARWLQTDGTMVRGYLSLSSVRDNYPSWMHYMTDDGGLIVEGGTPGTGGSGYHDDLEARTATIGGEVGRYRLSAMTQSKLGIMVYGGDVYDMGAKNSQTVAEKQTTAYLLVRSPQEPTAAITGDFSVAVYGGSTPMPAFVFPAPMQGEYLVEIVAGEDATAGTLTLSDAAPVDPVTMEITINAAKDVFRAIASQFQPTHLDDVSTAWQYTAGTDGYYDSFEGPAYWSGSWGFVPLAYDPSNVPVPTKHEFTYPQGVNYSIGSWGNTSVTVLAPDLYAIPAGTLLPGVTQAAKIQDLFTAMMAKMAATIPNPVGQMKLYADGSAPPEQYPLVYDGTYPQAITADWYLRWYGIADAIENKIKVREFDMPVHALAQAPSLGYFAAVVPVGHALLGEEKGRGVLSARMIRVRISQEVAYHDDKPVF